jgi:hypothetical protein
VGLVLIHFVEFEQKFVEDLLGSFDEDNLKMRVLQFGESKVIPQCLGVQINSLFICNLKLNRGKAGSKGGLLLQRKQLNCCPFVLWILLEMRLRTLDDFNL